MTSAHQSLAGSVVSMATAESSSVEGPSISDPVTRASNSTRKISAVVAGDFLRNAVTGWFLESFVLGGM
ncbi:hypothetical protein PJL18_00598 [Paenarthrobacter nicotinovorans]|nr:hypothetical protein [Paenarthrobacter nicotinovorans]